MCQCPSDVLRPTKMFAWITVRVRHVHTATSSHRPPAARTVTAAPRNLHSCRTHVAFVPAATPRMSVWYNIHVHNTCTEYSSGCSRRTLRKLTTERPEIPFTRQHKRVREWRLHSARHRRSACGERSGMSKHTHAHTRTRTRIIR